VSTTGQPTTFSELYTDLLNRMRADTTVGGMAETLSKRYLNIALHDIHIQHNWPWAERAGTIITRPPYTEGSISILDSARTTLVGTSTLWNTAVTGMGFNHINSGGKLRLAGDEEVYKISAIASDISATLLSRYVNNVNGASAYALAYSNYTYFEDEYALAADFFRLVDARQFSDVMRIECLGSQDFYQRYPRNANKSGTPRKCTIIELGPQSSTDWQPRVVFHPYPDDTHSIPYRYMTRYLAVTSAGVAQVELSNDTDEPIIPKRYRHILLSYASFLWYRDQKDDQRSQETYQEYVDGVKRIAGDSAPQRDFPSIRPRRMRSGPFFSRAASSRFTTGTNWDEMRE
jgi:hypothetical protein